MPRNRDIRVFNRDSKMNVQNQLRNELVELLREIVNVLGTEHSAALTDEDMRQYQARATRLHELSKKIHDPQSW